MKRIAMVVLSSYPIDVRVRREAEALFDAGAGVDVLCITQRGETEKENVRGINVFRLKLKRQRAGKFRYLIEYTVFFLWSFLKLNYLQFINRYDIIHVHNMPDFLVFTAIIPKLFGTKIVLDLHDPMPELFSSMINVRETHYIVKVLKFLEKISIKFADLVLTPNIAFKKLFISRGCPESKIQIIMNSPDEKVFRYQDNFTKNKKYASKFLLMYHGALVERHGLDIAVRAVAELREKIPNIYMVVYGAGNFLSEVEKLIDELKVKEFFEIKGFAIVDEIAAFIPQIDIGVIPNRINAFTQLNFPVRIFEYLINKKQVIVPRTSGIQDYFDDGSINYFESDNPTDLAKTIFKIFSNNGESKDMLDKSYRVYQNYTWELQKERLIETEFNLIK
jgi:glycosyltransferase involved in cell wall biosynthesis